MRIKLISVRSEIYKRVTRGIGFGFEEWLSKWSEEANDGGNRNEYIFWLYYSWSLQMELRDWRRKSESLDNGKDIYF